MLKEVFISLTKKSVYAITALPAPDLKEWEQKTILLNMTWNQEAPHEACVYRKLCSSMVLPFAQSIYCLK